MMIRLLYIECGIAVQKDWMNGVDRLQRAFVWYDGSRFWVERGDALPIPQKGDCRWIARLEDGGQYEEVQPVPARWNETFRTQMRGYRIVQTGEEIQVPL